MRISAENNELIFQRKESGEWFCKTQFLNFVFFFSFKESIFESEDTKNAEVDWKLVEEFVKHIFKNLELINQNGAKAIEEFQKIVHTNDPFYRKENGDFEVDGVELIDFWKSVEHDQNNNQLIRYRYKYNVAFFLENGDYDSQTRYLYTARFCNHHSLTLIGVYNDVWSLYKSMDKET